MSVLCHTFVATRTQLYVYKCMHKYEQESSWFIL